MKSFILILTSIILAFNLQAQVNYKVIKVNGNIMYVRTGDQM